MIRASVSHTKNHLSALLGQVREGETVLITDRERPIAQIVPVNDRSWAGQIESLAKVGLIRLPLGEPLSVEELLANQVHPSSNASVLEALLDERRDGR